MKKLLFTTLFLAIGIGYVFSQEDNQTDANPIIVPTQIITSPTEGDTLNTLVNAEGEESKVAYNNGVTLYGEGNYNEALSAFSQSLSTDP